MYIKRHISKIVEQMSKMFGAVIITGPRQVGKTTMLQETVGGSVRYLTLDDPVLLQSAKDDPASFLGAFSGPLFIDEIQYAPELFPFIKMKIDREHCKGAFFMSGSQQFHLMKNVSESLAGRAGILTMPGLSAREINGDAFDLPFLPTKDFLEARRADAAPRSAAELWRRIHRGSMPELWAAPDCSWELFWSSYTRTYLERDVRALAQVGDENKFLRFMTVCAARTGELLNRSALARDADISVPTAERWLSVLETSNIVYLLQPYYENISARMIKSPKLYFMDTGLAAYLTRWSIPEVLEHGAMAGPFFESYVVAEIIKSYYNAGIERPPLYFYRDKEQREIDLLIAENDKLHPVEIKKHATPRRDDTRSFTALKDDIRGRGAVVSMYENVVPLGDWDVNVPVWAL